MSYHKGHMVKQHFSNKKNSSYKVFKWKHTNKNITFLWCHASTEWAFCQSNNLASKSTTSWCWSKLWGCIYMCTFGASSKKWPTFVLYLKCSLLAPSLACKTLECPVKAKEGPHKVIVSLIHVVQEAQFGLLYATKHIYSTTCFHF